MGEGEGEVSLRSRVRKIDDNHYIIKLDENRTAALIRINPAKTWPADGDALRKRLKYAKAGGC
jgi:hypothetical protein